MDIYLDDISPAVKLLEEQGFVRAERHYFSAEYDLLAEFVGGDMPEKISEITAVQDSSNLKMPSCNSKALKLVFGHI